MSVRQDRDGSGYILNRSVLGQVEDFVKTHKNRVQQVQRLRLRSIQTQRGSDEDRISRRNSIMAARAQTSMTGS